MVRGYRGQGSAVAGGFRGVEGEDGQRAAQLGTVKLLTSRQDLRLGCLMLLLT